MEIETMGFTALMVIGAVNIFDYYKKDASTTEKWVVAFIVALIAGFVPVNMASEAAQRIKEAIETVLVGTGGYKLVTKASGK